MLFIIHSKIEILDLKFRVQSNIQENKKIKN